MDSDPSYPAFPVISFVGFVLVLIPLPWHLQAWNAGTCLFMIWTAIASLNLFINSILWHGNALNLAPVWCDISTRIIIAVAVAIPAASLCINRRLYHIASVKSVSITRSQKQRAIIIDLCIGLGFPLLEVVLAYVVTGHRFDIYEDIGCQPAIYTTPVTFALVICWPIVIGLASAVYCVLSLRAFNRRRVQFAEFLSSHSSLTISRYFRLMAIAITDLLLTVPISAYGIYLNVAEGGIAPWISWSDTHFNFSRVEQIPSVVWRSDRQAVISLELSRWLVPFCAFVFFAFFGLAGEAKRNYYILFVSVLKFFGRPPRTKTCISFGRSMPNHSSLMKSGGSLPTFTTRPPPPPLSCLPHTSHDLMSETSSPTYAETVESSVTCRETEIFDIYKKEYPGTSTTSESSHSFPSTHDRFLQ